MNLANVRCDAFPNFLLSCGGRCVDFVHMLPGNQQDMRGFLSVIRHINSAMYVTRPAAS
jgi:hypothetical protein